MASLMVITSLSMIAGVADDSDAASTSIELGQHVDGQTYVVQIGDTVTIWGGKKTVQYGGWWVAEEKYLGWSDRQNNSSVSMPGNFSVVDTYTSPSGSDQTTITTKIRGVFESTGTYHIEYGVYNMPDRSGQMTQKVSGSFNIEVTGFELTYHANNGTGETNTVEADSNVKLPQCMFTAEPDMEFAGWSLSSSGTRTYNPGATINLSGEADIYAIWRSSLEQPTASFTISQNGNTVSVNGKGSQYVEDYSWDFGDGYTSSRSYLSHTYNSPGTYQIVLEVTNAAGSDTYTRSVTIDAPEPEKVTLTVSAGTGGSVTGGGTYAIGTSVTIKATADSGFKFSHWSDGSTQSSRSVTVNNNMSLAATFEKVEIPVTKYTVSLSAGAGGSVNGSGSYVAGSSAVISATAENGFKFKSWSDGSTQNPRTITVNGSITLSANFVAVEVPIESVNLTVSAGTGGNVNGGGSYPAGTSVTITASPDTGYKFVKWSDGITQNPRTITVNSNTNISAEFQEISVPTVKYNIYVTPSIGGAVYGSGTYEVNSTAMIIATPADGFEFVKWSDGSTDNPRSIYVTKDASYVALFLKTGTDLVTYSVNLTAGDGGSVIGAGEYTPNTSVTITANADNGYKFVKWSDGSTDNSRIIIIENNLTLSAEFEKVSFTASPTTDIIVIMFIVLALIAAIVGWFGYQPAIYLSIGLGAIAALIWWL